MPVVIEDYVHRIGRTGRALLSGDAITFATEAEKYYVRKIEKLIRQFIPVAEIPEGVFIDETLYDERQAIAKEIDLQKRKENPEFQGAFHEKKAKNSKGSPEVRKAGSPKGGKSLDHQGKKFGGRKKSIKFDKPGRNKK